MASSFVKCNFCNGDTNLPQIGWRLKDSTYARLCVPCASVYRDGTFCDHFHRDEDGWRNCDECGRQVHCGCIMALQTFKMNDLNGVTCKNCLAKTNPVVNLGTSAPKSILKEWLQLNDSCRFQNNVTGQLLADPGRLELLNDDMQQPKQAILEGDLRQSQLNDSGIIFLFKRKLTTADCDSTIGCLLMPRFHAELLCPELLGSGKKTVAVKDTEGNCWDFILRWWTSKKSRKYLLDGAKQCCQKMQWKVGDILKFYRQSDGRVILELHTGLENSSSVVPSDINTNLLEPSKVLKGDINNMEPLGYGARTNHNPSLISSIVEVTRETSSKTNLCTHSSKSGSKMSVEEMIHRPAKRTAAMSSLLASKGISLDAPSSKRFKVCAEKSPLAKTAMEALPLQGSSHAQTDGVKSSTTNVNKMYTVEVPQNFMQPKTSIWPHAEQLFFPYPMANLVDVDPTVIAEDAVHHKLLGLQLSLALREQVKCQQQRLIDLNKSVCATKEENATLVTHTGELERQLKASDKRVKELEKMLGDTVGKLLDAQKEVASKEETLKRLKYNVECLNEEMKDAESFHILKTRAKLMKEYLDGKSSTSNAQQATDMYAQHFGAIGDLVSKDNTDNACNQSTANSALHRNLPPGIQASVAKSRASKSKLNEAVTTAPDGGMAKDAIPGKKVQLHHKR